MPNHKTNKDSQIILDASKGPDGVWRVPGAWILQNGQWSGAPWDLGDLKWSQVRVSNVRAFYTDENGNTQEIKFGDISDGHFTVI